MSVKITIRPNGPYRVEAPEGEIELVDANGTKYDLTGKPAFLSAVAAPASTSLFAMERTARSASRPQRPP